jgi:hypothetical protein
MKKQSKLEVLLSEVETLCEAYLGKKAEGEAWHETVERLRRIYPLVRLVKRQMQKADERVD